MAKIGDVVQIKVKGSVEEGILMPSEDKIIIIKLDNGYNMGFEKKDVQEIKVIKAKIEQKKNNLSQNNLPVDKNLKTISILHCGGTIASKVDYETGAVKAKFSPEELLEMFPELATIVNLRSNLVANMLSENMRFAHYNIIAKEIETEIKKGVQGIIITHGTDTLHYTAAALSFILENISIPVLLVGAQRSSDRGSSDAFLNLKCATQFIAKTEFRGVAVCMHYSVEDSQCAIISGVKARKMHSSRRDAFKSINSQPLALIDDTGKITQKHFSMKDEKKKLVLRLFDENIKVGIIKAHPQMFAEELKCFGKFDGLIVEGTGLGHLPIEKYDDYTVENELILKEISKLAKNIPVIMTTQTIFGGVNMNVYSPGRKLLEVGVLGNGLDMTPETAFIKLAWLLSNHPQKVKELMGANLRDEISNKRNYEKDFC